MMEPGRESGAQEPPPFLGSWSNVYLALVVVLLLECAAFWLLAEWAS